MSTKICPICGKEFVRNINSQKYCSRECYIKQCRKYYKKYCETNKERIKQYKKEYYETNEHRRKEYLKNNKDRIQKYVKKYRETNKETLKKYKQKYRREHKKNRNASLCNRRKTDNNYKLRSNLQSRLWRALKNNSKSASTLEFLGCTIEELWLYLEQQFQPGMTRENYGEWHVDHIIPCCNFDLKNPEQQKICFHYSNLQPLWAEENLRKSRK